MFANLLSLYIHKYPARLSSDENKTICKQSRCNLWEIRKPSTFYIKHVNHVKITIPKKLFDD